MLTLEKRNSIVSQLVDIYFNEEWWHTTKMPPEQAFNYHQTMLDKGIIQICEQAGIVLGYIEVWKINFEQFGKLICHAPFKAIDEDVISGNIAYLANTFIKKEYRKSYVKKVLKLKFFSYTHNCQYYVGNALRKSTQPVKVFCKDNLQSKLFLEGEV